MIERRLSSRLLGMGLAAFLLAAACGSSGDADVKDDDKNSDGDGDGDGNGNGDNNGNGGFDTGGDAGAGSGGRSEGRDPVDCKEAADTHSYVGCDYWPTITPNSVYADAYNFAVVVANTGTTDADVAITGPNSFSKNEKVPAGGLATIKLPWVADLKGPDWTSYILVSYIPQRPAGALSKGGAYHLVSSSPVIVYQFNPLEYSGTRGKSVSNDASLLLPSTAMRNIYRVIGMRGWTTTGAPPIPSMLTVTATADNTEVKVHLSKTASTDTAGPIPATSGGSVLTFKLDKAGDVASIPGKGSSESDFSGSIVEASAPVQVITSVPCIYVPSNVASCDHIEETVIPAEALGKKYVVGTPTKFDGKAGVHWVRFVGNSPDTKLTYFPEKPAKCPDTLSPGQVADCEIVDKSFGVEGDKEFTIQSFLVGSSYYGLQDNSDALGDPSETNYPALEQFRKKYIFLAPKDYPKQFADVTAPKGTTLTLDGAAVTAPFEPIGDGSIGVFRLDLTTSGSNGVHSLEASQPVGVQVLGYAPATSFQYPAGLNLNLISKAPDPVVN